MPLDLTDAEKFALIDLLKHEIDSARYPLSPRVQTLPGILEKLEPQPGRAPLPLPKVYAPPRAAVARRRRRG
jgi:hypothetical protein